MLALEGETQSNSYSDDSWGSHSSAPSLVCKADVIYSKQECPRSFERRVRDLHLQLSEQAKRESTHRGETPLSVVTMVQPISAESWQAPPSVTGSSISTLSSTGSSSAARQKSIPARFPRTRSMIQLPAEVDEPVKSHSTSHQGITVELADENNRGFTMDAKAAPVGVPKTIYHRFMSYLIGWRSP